ncbi:MAG: Ribonuclease P protein component [Candidatus Woesebacteria bacterium GW2011_GWB1_45_5]|uniref:Ribonuclease P protein component n=1 Tax=Candidatus Woesebacteria bacterium GW2011_GWB1_45_5 TaxID=1618581 RepID=A0A0G1MPB6_9BACT|nr:MAG: Ribonuclease P protein component [Candidatus Woesebacteria bacterium GW2011_GWB1_45_5]
MLAKKSRLTGVKNFKNVEERGEIYQSQNFGVARVKRGDEEPSRFAFVVSTKISKDAVDRNRFKRTMSEAVRLSSIDIKNGFDVVFLAKTSIVRTPTSELMKEVKRALLESGLLK